MKVASNKPKGTLYQKYHNTITKLRRHELWSPKKSVLNKSKSENQYEHKLQEFDGKFTNYYYWLWFFFLMYFIN